MEQNKDLMRDDLLSLTSSIAIIMIIASRYKLGNTIIQAQLAELKRQLENLIDK